MVRAKFRLSSITQNYYNKDDRKLSFSAVQDDGTDENARFAKFTPSGTLDMVCNNPAVLLQMALGAVYYLDFTPCPEMK